MEIKRFRKAVGGLERLAVVGVGIAALGLGAQRAEAQSVQMRTEFPETNLIADGETVYQFNVRAGTLEIPGVGFNGCDWDVTNIPDYFTMVGATLPDGTNNTAGPSTNPSDFYFPQPPNFDGVMDPSWNRIDSSAPNGVLSDNVRIVNNVFTGPADNDDMLLGIYYFTVNLGAPLESNQLDLGTVAFSDTNFNEYNSDDAGSGVEETHDIFTIVSPDTTPPIQSNHNPPSGSMIAETYQFVTFNTDENGFCRYSVNEDLPYIDMVNDTNGAGTMAHDFTATGMPEGDNLVSIACRDNIGNEDTADTNTDLTYFVELNTPAHQFRDYFECVSGPNIPYTGEGCAVYDFDQDGDVDFHDFAEFQRTVSE